ncbi:MAG: HEAT repeat domain-containing protein, partial [Candidatus Cybelea sp.]
REAIATAFDRERFWGVLVEAAHATGATRAPWAREVLIGVLSHEHPKVVRAAAEALGNFRDAEVAEALVALAGRHASYFVRAAALTALGKTRDARAFDVLVAATRERSWNGVIEAGALRGLAELADARAMPVLVDACRPEGNEGARRAAIASIARLATLVESERTRGVDAVAQHLDDEMFMVALEATAAAEALGDDRLLPELDRVGQQAFDGRLRRNALEAAIRIRKSAKIPAQVTALRDDIDELREQHRRLQEKIETIART